MLQCQVYSSRPESGCERQRANLHLESDWWVRVLVEEYTTYIACLPGESLVPLLTLTQGNDISVPITSVNAPRMTEMLNDHRRHLIIWASWTRQQMTNMTQNPTVVE
jgi:hypothetical protein